MRFNRYPDKSSAVVRQRDCRHEQLKIDKFFGKTMLGCGRCEMLWEVEDATFMDQKLSEVRETFEQRETFGDDHMFLSMGLVGSLQ